MLRAICDGVGHCGIDQSLHQFNFYLRGIQDDEWNADSICLHSAPVRKRNARVRQQLVGGYSQSLPAHISRQRGNLHADGAGGSDLGSSNFMGGVLVSISIETEADRPMHELRHRLWFTRAMIEPMPMTTMDT